VKFPAPGVDINYEACQIGGPETIRRVIEMADELRIEEDMDFLRQHYDLDTCYGLVQLVYELLGSGSLDRCEAVCGLFGWLADRRRKEQGVEVVER
jgi:hypothetical protein